MLDYAEKKGASKAEVLHKGDLERVEFKNPFGRGTMRASRNYRLTPLLFGDDVISDADPDSADEIVLRKGARTSERLKDNTKKRKTTAKKSKEEVDDEDDEDEDEDQGDKDEDEDQGDKDRDEEPIGQVESPKRTLLFCFFVVCGWHTCVRHPRSVFYFMCTPPVRLAGGWRPCVRNAHACSVLLDTQLKTHILQLRLQANRRSPGHRHRHHGGRTSHPRRQRARVMTKTLVTRVQQVCYTVLYTVTSAF
jgi:hypothetical protein